MKHIVYMEDVGVTSEPYLFGMTNNWTVASSSKVESLGWENPTDTKLPITTNIAIKMYTNGSTSMAKGLMMTHGNVVVIVARVMTIVPSLGKKDTYLAYLPHILESAVEAVMVAIGSAIGYGLPLTLTDTPNKINKGTKVDVAVLGPTFMTVVPTILDCVRDSVQKKVKTKGGLSKKLFDIAYSRRFAAIKGSWIGACSPTKHLWDALVFNKKHAVLGGHIRGLFPGGAPLSGNMQRFINICLGAPIEQGYGLMETCAAGTFSEWDDTTGAHVDPPPEGGYLTTNSPMLREEIGIGEQNVTQGYFKNKIKTDEVYKVDEGGMQ
eukprot:Gb_34317 [translate_table: standard]